MKLKILLVEDNAVYASVLKIMLVKLGYDPPVTCGNYDDAIALLATREFHFAILDLHLNGEKDGIDVARYINLEVNIPFIFLTASPSFETFEYIKEVNPYAFLVKPIRESDLFAAIEIALLSMPSNVKTSLQGSRSSNRTANKTSLFIKDGENHHKINFDEILYIVSSHVYVTLHTGCRQFLVRASLAVYADLLDHGKFIRVHRSHIINIDKVEKINKNSVTINGEEIPVSKTYRKDLLKAIATPTSV
jgi:DNA-binding LytR/AlgR family response regulator